MLGRLKMSISECITAYYRLAGTIFKEKEYSGWYDPTILEQAVKDIVHNHLGDENAPMMSPQNDRCKVYDSSFFFNNNA